jgi:Asp-tRNA(Asn)/Glu-tRNA(Gln) amidotransferase A subunit family amidase
MRPSTSAKSRRHFLKLAATAATATLAVKASAQTVPATGPATAPGATTGPVAGRGRGGGRGPQPLPALGNGENPAMVFQPYPGGTGAYLAKTYTEQGVAAFERKAIGVPAWEGPVPASEEEIAFLPVYKLAALIQAQKLSPVELTRIYLDRLKKFDPKLLFAVTIMEGQAKEAAQQAETEIKAGKYRGPLHGIPWGVKDLFAVKGTPTTWGAAEFKDRMIDEDAEIVRRLNDAGAILVAKLATGRFALGDQWYRGRTNNPWNPAAGSSGSSAGPASATAAGCVAFGIGTETRGSITSPASTCGLCALRPTYGRVPRTGGMVLAWTQDRVGPFARSAFDLALVFNVIHGVDENDNSTVTAPFAFNPGLAAADLAKMKIGYDASVPQEFVDKLKEMGATPVPMPRRPAVPASMNSLDPEEAAAFDGVIASGALKDVDTNYGLAREGAPGGRFTAGRSVLAVDFLKIQRHRMILIQAMAKVFADFDLYACNTDIGDTTLTSMTGHPALVLPCSFGRATGRGGANAPEQPHTTTLIGRLYGEDKLASVACAYQKVTDFHTRRPNLTV